MTIAIDPQTVAAAVFGEPARAEKAAFVDAVGGKTSYSSFGRSVETLVENLRSAGLGPNDRIATVAPRGPAGLLVFLAASSVAPCCPLNPAMRTGEFAAAFQSMGVTALLVGDVASTALMAAAAAGLTILAFDENGAATVKAVGSRSGSGHELTPSGTALLMQTSGTTSAPKLVPLTHANILAAAQGIVDAFALKHADICLNPMPLHHVHGLLSAGVSSLLAGSTLCCLPGFSPASFDAALTSTDPTWFTASPAMHQSMRDFFEREGRAPNGRRLRFFRSSSAPLPAAVIADLETLYDAPLTETYGLTETASMICANPLPPRLRKPGSVGIAVGTEIRIADATGAGLPAGEDGEVLIRGASVITSYMGRGIDPSANFHGDWLRTGDVGHLDEDGYLYIVGRTKELIKRGGLSVYPAEVDNALAAHPNVVEAVTFSLPHPTLGEELAAAVVCGSGDKPDEADLRTFVAQRLSSYKVPAVILAVDALPKNETGKILRRDMSRHFAPLLVPRNEAPSNAREDGLLAIWREVLGREDFGVGDNLLLVGADPLRAGRAASLVQERLGYTLSAKDMIASPTVRDMSCRT